VAQNARIDELRKKLEREPGSPLFAQYAEELRRAGELGEAIRICREGLTKHPAYATARITLARALATSGDAASARAEFEAVLRTAPDNVIAKRGLDELASDGARAWDDKSGATAAPVAPPPVVDVSPLAEATTSATIAVEAEPPAAAEAAAAQPPAEVTPPAPVASVTAAPEEARPTAEDEEFELEQLRPAAPSGPPQLTFRPLFEAEESHVAAPAPVRLGAATAATSPQPEPEASKPPRDERPPGAELASPTLAELYFEQGSFERAAEIYEELLAREPGNARFAARLQDARARKGLRAEPGQRGKREELLRRAIARLEELRSRVRNSEQSRAHGAGA
jgi:tetratricopeptide (TPR) repeat protein